MRSPRSISRRSIAEECFEPVRLSMSAEVSTTVTRFSGRRVIAGRPDVEIAEGSSILSELRA